MNIRDKILIVEDERSITNFLRTILTSNDYDVIIARSGAEAYSMITSHCPDLIVLDLGLPDIDGLQIIKSVREWTLLPIVVVSARAHERDKVEALDLGADDYITKPFNPLEVTARVKTVLRRCRRGAETNDEMDIRGLTINRASRRCSLFGRELALTPTEFDILWYLCDNAGRVVASEELFEAVWKEKFLTSSSNTVMAHIGRLREKMHEPARKPKFIKTVWGVGYEIEK